MPSLNHGEILQTTRSDGQKVNAIELASDNFQDFGRQDGNSNGSRFGADENGNGGVLTQGGTAYIYDPKFREPVSGKMRIKGSDGKLYEFDVTEVV